MMSDDIDWLRSHRGVCKICFVDVSTLNVEDEVYKDAAGSSSEGNLNLGNLEEKEIIMIKDTEKTDQSKVHLASEIPPLLFSELNDESADSGSDMTEVSVCFFKQAPSDPASVLNWLLSDLQKYALGFQHALSPSTSICKHKVEDTKGEYHTESSENCYSVYADQVNIDYLMNRPQNLRLAIAAAISISINITNNHQSPSAPPAKPPSTQRAVISPDGECSIDDLSFYVNRLSSLVIQMAHKEIKEKLEFRSKCLHHSIYPSPGNKERMSPQTAVSKIASEMAIFVEAVELTAAEMCGTEEKSREGGQKSFLYSELSNKSKSGDNQMSQRESKEFAESISKGLMVYANQVASDMMVSVMKTLKVHSSGKPVPACVVLKRVLLRHTKEIVSDLIDFCMKNLHIITGVLMTDSDFVSAVKRNLFNQWKQNAADIMEAMLKRLVSALIGEKKETKSQSLSYASLKAGSHDPKCRNQSLEFSTMKAEMKGRGKGKMKSDPCKSLTSAKKVGEHILKEGLTIWNPKQGNPCKVATKACSNKDEQGEKISASTDSLAKDLIVSALKLIQYHLTQQTKGKDTREEDCPGSTMGYMAQSIQYEKWGGGQGAKALSVKHLEYHRAPGPSTCKKENQPLDSQKMDISSIVLMLIQKLLHENPFKCEDPRKGENKHSEPRASKATYMSKRSDKGEEQCQDHQELDFINGMKQVNWQFINW
ncbi:hypothetical protein H8958_001155 [Nasalis larvatus]